MAVIGLLFWLLLKVNVLDEWGLGRWGPSEKKCWGKSRLSEICAAHEPDMQTNRTQQLLHI